MQPTSFQPQRSPLTPEVVPLESTSGHSQHEDSKADVHQTPNMAARLGKRINKKSSGQNLHGPLVGERKNST